MPRRPSWHYVVGDVHGCFDTLRALEERIARHADRHDVHARLVFVGDLVDRGPRSAEVVGHVREGVARGDVAAVLGNHDLLLLQGIQDLGVWDADLAWPAHLRTVEMDRARGGEAARTLSREDYRAFRRFLWITQGGHATLTSYGCDPHRPSTWRLPADDLRFLLERPLVWQNASVVVTHALVDGPDLGLARRLFLGRGVPPGSLDLARDACERTMTRRDVPATPPDAGRAHVSGHTPVERVRRYRARRLVQLDTGCVYGGRLSAWCAEADATLSEPLRDRVR